MCGGGVDSERFVLYLDIMGLKERVKRTNVFELKESLINLKKRNVK